MPKKSSNIPKEFVSYVAIVLSLIAIVLSGYAITHQITKTVYVNVTTNTTLKGYNITSNLLTPPYSVSDGPVVTANQSFGHRLTNINLPFNSSQLNAINNAPNTYFEKAGEMFLNHTLKNTIGIPAIKLPAFKVNGKPTVIYLGSITCIFCGENRWAMALALSRFGNFSALFAGYSSIGDGDLPTVYWAPAHYNTSSTQVGNFYSSKYLNFISIEDANPISGGFNLNPISTMQQRVNQTSNLAYADAMQFVINTKGFQGTPFTIWGNYQVGGADAVVFGNTTPANSTIPMQSYTHQYIIGQLANPTSQFALSEYAAADYYVAMICKTINNAAPVCTLPSIQNIETSAGL